MQESGCSRRGQRGRVFHRTLDHLPAHLSLCAQLRLLPPARAHRRNRRLSALAIHSDLDCPQHPERNLEELDSVDSGSESFHSYSTPTHPLLAWLCPQRSVFRHALVTRLLSVGIARPREGLQPRSGWGGE